MGFAIEDRVFRRNRRLHEIAQAASEAFGSGGVSSPDARSLRDVVLAIKRTVASVPGAYACFVGGLAVQEHGYVRATEDVDVVVDSAHFREIIQRLRDVGFELTSKLCLRHRPSGILVDVLREGAVVKSARFPVPHPRDLGPNLGFATLPALIRLKLESGRIQDQADVVSLLKRRLPDIEVISQQIPEALRAEYQRLAAIARQEADAGPPRAI